MTENKKLSPDSSQPLNLGPYLFWPHCGKYPPITFPNSVLAITNMLILGLALPKLKTSKL